MFLSNNPLTMLKGESFANRMIILILLCYPALLLTVNGAMGVCFFLALLVSIFSLHQMRATLSTSHWDKYSIAFALAMASPVLAIFLSQAYHVDFDSEPYDWASRFLLAIPIYLALRQTNSRIITVLQFGIPLGLLVGLIKLLIDPFIWVDVISRYTTFHAFDLIHFSASVLILGFLSLFAVNWDRRDHNLVLTLKYCGFLAGIVMSLQSGERGSWIAIPPLLFLWATSQLKGKLWAKLLVTMLVIVSMTWLTYTLSEVVHDRFNSAFNELSNRDLAHKDSSIGIRLQLWLAALHLFIEQPFFGVGPHHFAQSLAALQANGMLTPEAVKMGHSEVHSEILAKCVETGLFGLLSFLSVYLVPMYIFWRSCHSTTLAIRTAGFMGVCFVLGFFIFGLTVEIFNLKVTASFFSLTLAVLMAASTHKSTS